MPYPGVNESMAVTYWQTPDENLTPEAVATREYIKEQFVSDNVTYIVFSLDGPITEDSRNFVDDVRSERSELIDDLVVGSDGKLMVNGFAAYSQDVLDAIVENLPIALAFIFDNSADIYSGEKCNYSNQGDCHEHSINISILWNARVCFPMG